MGPKRKAKGKDKALGSPKPKRAKPSTGANQATNAINIQQIKSEITKTVPETVLTTLRESGLLQQENNNGTDHLQRTDDFNTSNHSNSVTNIATSTPVQAPIPQPLNTISLVYNSSSSASPSCRAEHCPSNNGKFVSSKIPLHATVFLKKRKKIWANEFIDLFTLQDDEVEDFKTYNIRNGTDRTDFA